MKMVTKNNTILINLIAREQEQKNRQHTNCRLLYCKKIGAATLQAICIQNFITANSITLCCRVYCISMKVFRFDTFENEMSLAFYFSLSFSHAIYFYSIRQWISHFNNELKCREDAIRKMIGLMLVLFIDMCLMFIQ